MVVRPVVDDPSPPKDANEALLAGRNLQEFLDGETQQELMTVNRGVRLARREVVRIVCRISLVWDGSVTFLNIFLTCCFAWKCLLTGSTSSYFFLFSKA